jgi:hypothetical protein
MQELQIGGTREIERERIGPIGQLRRLQLSRARSYSGPDLSNKRQWNAINSISDGVTKKNVYSR